MSCHKFYPLETLNNETLLLMVLRASWYLVPGLPLPVQVYPQTVVPAFVELDASGRNFGYQGEEGCCEDKVESLTVVGGCFNWRCSY
jgi:hypothetical protein